MDSTQPIGPKHRFLEGFFNPEDGLPRETADLFDFVFERPPDFAQLVNAVNPRAGRRKVVILDGQSRVGKTWAALGVIGHLLDQGVSGCWTAGEDSYKVFSFHPSNKEPPAPTLLEGLNRICVELAKTPAPLVLLDDVFGTFALRTLPNSEPDLDMLRRLLDFTAPDHPFFKPMPPSGRTVVITSRASLLALVEAVLGVRIRRSDTDDIVWESRGIYRDLEGKAFGSLTERELTRIRAKYESLCSHGVDTHQPYIVVYTSDPPVELAASEATVTALFGQDLDALAKHSERMLRREVAVSSQIDQTGDSALNVWRLYLLAVAPGLLFVGPGTYELLGINAEQARGLLVKLALRPQKVDGQVSAHPNEIYPRAIKSHLAQGNRLDLVGATINRVLVRSHASALDYQIAIRGLLERSLEVGRVELSNTLTTLAEAYHDPLFDWERLLIPQKRERVIEAKPGFVSALGWAQHRFSSLHSAVGEEIRRHICEDLDQGVESWDGQLSETERHLLVARYSTFLQWSVMMELDKRGSSFLERLKTYAATNRGVASQHLRLVFEDELIWASTLSGANVETLPMLGSVRASLEEDVMLEVVDPFIGANRLFSLSWHNEWRDFPETCVLAGVLDRWRVRFEEPILSAVGKQPDLLDANLQYHWWHFLTQHGVWMRNWCFAGDPLKWESNRPAPGSQTATDNTTLVELVERVLHPGSESSMPGTSGSAVLDDRYARRLRNCLLLIGLRWRRLPFIPKRLLQEDWLADSGLREYALMALFELGRLGHLASLDLTQESGHPFAKWLKILPACEESILISAWSRYSDELSHVTHLDLLPHSPQDVLPSGWVIQNMRHYEQTS